MNHRWRMFLFGMVIVASAVVVSACYQGSVPDSVAPLPPTWTPTAAPHAESEMPKATSLPTIPSSEVADHTETSTQIVLETPVQPTATSIPPKVVATSAPVTIPVAAKNGRIDEAGPVAVTTVEPLVFGSGMAPTRLLIPALNLDTPVETMGWKVIEDAKGLRSEWEVIDFAAGHHVNSAFPGEAGNVVLSGHNNIGGSVFKSVCVIGQPGVDFGLGDEMILVDESGRRFAYQVNGWRRMQEANASIAQRQDNAQYLNPTTDAQLTLVTCWPPNSNTHRVVVTGLLTGME